MVMVKATIGRRCPSISLDFILPVECDGGVAHPAPRHLRHRMQSTPPGEPSPFDDGDFYDLICQGLEYGIDFYVDLARQARGPVLDIACGTGRILLPVLQAGVDADGLDLFEPMLETARRKAAALGFIPDLNHGDMADFELPRRYALIMITFNAFCHMLTTDDQLRCLGCIRRHLLPGGLLAFDGGFPGLAWIGAPQDQRELEGELKDPRTGKTMRCYDTRTFDRVAQIQRSRNEVELDEPDGTTRIIHRSEFLVRWTYKPEMDLLLRSAGFAQYESTAASTAGRSRRKPTSWSRWPGPATDW